MMGKLIRLFAPEDEAVKLWRKLCLCQSEVAVLLNALSEKIDPETGIGPLLSDKQIDACIKVFETIKRERPR